MKVVNISEAKNQLSRYLDMVRNGQRVRIVDRSVPVADLVPIEPSSAEDDAQWIASLARRGLAMPGRKANKPLPKALLKAGPKPKQSTLEALLDERREGR